MERLGDDASVAVGLDGVAPLGGVLEGGRNQICEPAPWFENGDFTVGVPLVVTRPVVAPELRADRQLGRTIE